MDNVACTGNESRLVDCPFAGFGNHNCNHLEDAGVICSVGTVAPAMGTTVLMLAAVALIVSGTVVLRRRKQTA
jgi:LPXTG-motif cell wall-anchored protein